MKNDFGEDDQYKLNQWQQFIDKKIAQFFQKHLKQYDQLKNFYYDFINVISLIIVKFLYKKPNHIIMMLSMAFILVHIILTYSKKQLQLQMIINHLLDFLILIALLGTSRENEVEFIIRLCFQIAIQTSKLMIFQYNQFQQAIENLTKIGIVTIIRWQLIQDFSIQKIVIFLVLTIFYQTILSLITLAYSYSYKIQWINLEKIKKANQINEKLFFELPFAIIIFTQDGRVHYQNSISYKFLPKPIDVMTKNYSNEISKFTDLILNEDDKKKFVKSFQEALDTDETIVFSFAFQGHPIPIRCQLRKQVLNKSSIIEAIFQEKSDDQSVIYDRISQSLQIIKIQQISEILSKQQEKIKLNLLQTLFPMCCTTDYQKTDQIVCNLQNYFKFLADYLQIVFQISPNVKIENDFPDQQFTDIVKLHSILTQIIYYIFNEHTKQKIYFGQSQKQLMLLSQSEKANYREIHNFSLISFLINTQNEKLEVTIQIDYHNQIQDSEKMFQKFNLEKLKSFESRMEELLLDDLKYTTFIHIIHQIFSIEGEIDLRETLDNIKIQLNFPTRSVKDYENPLFENYNSMGKFDALSKIYSINNDNFQAFRVKSSAQITSTQRIQSLANQKPIEEITTVRAQTSLSELKNLNFYKCEDIVYRPKTVSEEEKQDHNQLMSPNLSPINKPTLLKQTDVANFDIEDRINNQMPQVEKAVSKVLEQVLSEIMTFKGQRINVHFKNSKSKQKSFETSPSNSSVQQQNQRNTSVPNLQQYRTTIPEQKEQNTQQQQQQQSQHTTTNSIFRQNANQQQQQLKNQPQQQSVIHKKNQNTQILKNLRETDSGKQILNLEQSDQLGYSKQDENLDDLKNSVKFIAQTQDDQIQKSQQSQTSLGLQQMATQGSEKSPCFKVQKQVTVNDIDSQAFDSSEAKKYLNDKITIMIVDESQSAIQTVATMKFKKSFLVQSSTKSEEAIKLIEQQLKTGKIFHLVILKINMSSINGIELIKIIREQEIKYNLPKQIIIGTDNEFNQNIKNQCIKAGFDELQEKPLRQAALESLIDKVLKQSPKFNLKTKDEQEKINSAQAQLDELQFPEKISSFQDIPIKNIQPQSRKSFYNETATIFLIDNSNQQINAFYSMRFSYPKKFEFSKDGDDGLKKIRQTLSSKKIYHVILINTSLSENNGEKILNQIRSLEKELLMPQQFIIGINTDFEDEKDSKSEYLDKNRIACKQLGYDATLRKMIDFRQLDLIISERFQDE